MTNKETKCCEKCRWYAQGGNANSCADLYCPCHQQPEKEVCEYEEHLSLRKHPSGGKCYCDIKCSCNKHKPNSEPSREEENPTIKAFREKYRHEIDLIFKCKGTDFPEHQVARVIYNLLLSERTALVEEIEKIEIYEDQSPNYIRDRIINLITNKK